MLLFPPLLRCLSVLGLLGATACTGGEGAEDPVHVYAAASTAQALNEVLDGLQASGGPRAVAVVGASSAMARQIEQGAPADLYLSANPAWMDHLADGGFVGADTRVDLLANSLVLVAPAGAAPDPYGDLSGGLAPGLDLAAALGAGRLAVGDPDHVPAGMYAREALGWLGAWEAVEPRLARAPDVRAALALVERGEVSLGIVYATDAAASDGVRVVATFPPAAHAPVTYPLGIVRTHGEDSGVHEVYDHLQSPAAAAVFARHGFRRP